MNEKEAEAQYEIISKMSFSEILELLIRGCDNPINSRNLTQEETIVYAGGFGIWPIEKVVTEIKGRMSGGASKSLSLFIVSKIIEPPVSAHYGESDRKGIQYWMYSIRFVGDALFKELYTVDTPHIVGVGAQLENYERRRRHANMLGKLDRPTIVFNVTTGDKWICDWKHPKESFHTINSPLLKFHEGSGSVFDKSQIVILNPIILNHYFLNWNKENPWEVKR